jgi:predicted metal-binding membrane protein
VNDIVNNEALTYLSPAETRLAAVLARPKPVAIACVLALAALGWASCGLMLADPASAWLDALCRPALGRASNAFDVAFVIAMWVAMTLAMMLPSAGPMILTYAEIADTAARKREFVVSPLVLTAGYTAVWLGIAFIAALLQWLLASTALAEVAKVPAPVAGALFLAAGLYQFSSLKQACLALCQRPFPFFFANWTTAPRGVFVLGLRQGLYCLGCCWALMLVMFAAGSMNVLWMAALGALMTIEKLTTTARFSRALGVAFMAIGTALVAMEFK